MNVLLDERIPRKLKHEIPSGNHVSTVMQAGWAGKKNGELLALAQKKFDVFVTVDQNLSYQQNISKYQIAEVLLEAKDNDIDTLRPLFSKACRALESMENGRLFRIRS